MKKYLIYLAVIVVIGAIFYKKVFIPKHTFETTQAQKGDMEVYINGIGNVGAQNIYKIGSIYGGKVYDFNITLGEKISKGQVIARVDSVDLKDKIKELKYNIEKVKNDIKSLEIQKESAIVNYQYQADVYEKNKKLYLKKAISELDFKKYKTNKETAQLQIENLLSNIDSLYKQIDTFKASIDGLEEKLKRYTIISQVDGIVTKKLISNHQTIMPNQALIEVVNPKDVWIETHIDTRISGDVKIGDISFVKLRSSTIQYPAKVVKISPYNNPITYEREIDVRLNKVLIPFYMEEQAKVKIHIKSLKNVTKIPSNVLSFYKGKEGVWLLENNKAHFKVLKILAHTTKFVATDDINSETIIVPNPSKKTLVDGMKIYHD